MGWRLVCPAQLPSTHSLSVPPRQLPQAWLLGEAGGSKPAAVPSGDSQALNPLALKIKQLIAQQGLRQLWELFVLLRGSSRAGIFDSEVKTLDSLSLFIKFLDKWLDRGVLQVLTELNRIITTGIGKGEVLFPALSENEGCLGFCFLHIWGAIYKRWLWKLVFLNS